MTSGIIYASLGLTAVVGLAVSIVTSRWAATDEPWGSSRRNRRRRKRNMKRLNGRYK